MQRVIVVGAGVVGLTCAVRLAEAGFDTHVLARDLPLETTSVVAGGLWMPYLSGPLESVRRWGAATFTELAHHHREHPRSGVLMRDGMLLHRDGPAPRPQWADLLEDVPGFTGLHAVRDPRPGFAAGWALRVPVVDTTRYLPWLSARLEAAGGTVTRMPLPALPERGIVVNATGVSARALATDPLVRPSRGQVVIVRAPQLTDWWTVEDTDVDGETCYVIPRTDHVVVGGTTVLDDFDTEPRPAVALAILERATRIEPRLAGAEVLRHRVGLRPTRPQVRLETELCPDRPERAVVHCYGHGGSGWTLSWGCADDVLTEVRALA